MWLNCVTCVFFVGAEISVLTKFSSVVIIGQAGPISAEENYIIISLFGPVGNQPDFNLAPFFLSNLILYSFDINKLLTFTTSCD